MMTVRGHFAEVTAGGNIDVEHPEKSQVEATINTLTGDLTIKGTTRPVKLKAVKCGEFNDPQMGHRIGYAAETKINHKDFGMEFDMMLDGKFIVSHDIQINIEGEILESAD